ncbi:hypothetical protein JTB14_030850 [Gonioctena quinquepunctata]|nr:hypothetical protein JTB14_030850 [Gonioctena quinquepunctata]
MLAMQPLHYAICDPPRRGGVDTHSTDLSKWPVLEFRHVDEVRKKYDATVEGRQLIEKEPGEKKHQLQHACKKKCLKKISQRRKISIGLWKLRNRRTSFFMQQHEPQPTERRQENQIRLDQTPCTISRIVKVLGRKFVSESSQQLWAMDQ